MQKNMMKIVTLLIITILLSSYIAYEVEIGESNNSSNILKSNSNNGPDLQLIQQLAKRLEKTKYTGNGALFKHIKGIYESYVKMNVVSNDDRDLQNFWQRHQCPDNNMFVTNFVLYSLIHCKEMGTMQFGEEYIEEQVKAILGFKDKNFDSDIPIYDFWPQIQQGNDWVTFPENVYIGQNYLRKLPKFMQRKIKKKYGLSVGLIDLFSHIFKIPSDNDDTGVNIVLGRLLNDNKKEFPNLHTLWQQNNQDYYGLYLLIKKYAYRPFSSDQIENTIDPRTYYILRGFLEDTEQKAKMVGTQPSRILFNTWITSIQDQKIGVEVMPFSVNNVDLTVSANALYGLISLIQQSQHGELVNMFKFYDNDIRQIIKDTTDLLVWSIENRIVLERPELSLTYYPSIYNFYWFVARLGSYLREEERSLRQLEIKYCQRKLEKVLKSTFTDQLVELAQKDQEGNIYWEQFLGDYPGGKQHSDRAYSSAMALNSLMETWTEKNSNNNGKKLQYVRGCPQKVKQIIENGVNNLSAMMRDKKTPLENTFFSGSIKGIRDFPFWYPANNVYVYNKEKNIKVKIDASQEKINPYSNNVLKNYPEGSTIVFGQSGVIDKQVYNEQVKNQEWFGQKTPQEFLGYNQNLDPFPYWTSDSITLSFSMLAFSRYITLEK